MLRPAFPEVAGPLASIKSTAVHTFGVAVHKADVPIGPVKFIIPLDWRFFSAVSRDTVPDAEWRGFAFHFPPGVSRDQALAQAAAVLKVDPSRLEDVVEREVVLPSPVVGHAQVAQAIADAVKGTQLFVTGNYFGGLAIEDCVTRSAEEAERLAEAE